MSGWISESPVGTAPAPLAVALMVSLAAMNLSAANWPAWRGGDGDGLCTETNVPLRWSPTENIRWRTPLPEAGNSTPVVWNDHIFVTQNIGSRRSLMCFGRARGDLLWTAGVEVTARERSWHENPYCSPSPVTDGQRVICWFGSGGVVAYDFAGQELWRLDLGRHDHQYGYGSSPVLYGDLCFLNFGPGEHEFVVALDKHTGRELWRAVSPAPGRNDTLGTWSTPLLTTFAGRPQLVVALRDYLAALDPKTGNELWRCTGLGPQAKTSPVAGEGVVILSGDVQSAELAVKLGGEGDVTATHRLWRRFPARPRVSTGLILGRHYYGVRATGIMDCLQLDTGEVVWEERLRGPGGHGTCWSSPVLGAGRLYVMNQAGDTFVVQASPRYGILGVNSLGERANASVVISGGQVILRTHQALWCIGGPEAPRQRLALWRGYCHR